MTDLSPPSDIAVVFCGGQHRRFGRLAGFQAKTLLVAYDAPLLWRLFDQLRAAGFTHILASTTPALGGQIRDSVEHYTKGVASGGRIDVVVSEAQQRGIVFGMREVLEASSVDRCLICLGDIFFAENPFPAFHSPIASDEDAVGTAPLAGDDREAVTGLIYEDRQRVSRFVERPAAFPVAGAVRWSGVVMSNRRHALVDLDAYVRDLAPDVPLGDFLEFQRQRGRAFRTVAGPDFVNVNSPNQLLFASLQAYVSEEGNVDPATRAAFVRTQEALRRGHAGPKASW